MTRLVLFTLSALSMAMLGFFAVTAVLGAAADAEEARLGHCEAYLKTADCVEIKSNIDIAHAR